MRDDDRSQAELLEIGIVAAEVVVNRSRVREAVEHAHHPPARAHRVHAERARGEHRMSDIAVKLLDDIVSEHARHPAPLPARAVQFEERLQHRINILRAGFLEGELSLTLVIAELFLKVRRRLKVFQR